MWYFHAFNFNGMDLFHGCYHTYTYIYVLFEAENTQFSCQISKLFKIIIIYIILHLILKWHVCNDYFDEHWLDRVCWNIQFFFSAVYIMEIYSYDTFSHIQFVIALFAFCYFSSHFNTKIAWIPLLRVCILKYWISVN